MSDIPTPAARVTAIFDDGPHQGETLHLPWARLEIPMTAWIQEDLVESLYRLAAPWRGQDSAHYALVVESVERAA